MNLAWLPWIGKQARGVCTPGMNCHGCPAATGACPIGSLAFSTAIRSPSMAVVGSLAAVGLGTGRLVCGFACPFGWFQDLLYRIPGPKIRLPRWSRYGKYVMLFGFVLMLPWLMGLGSGGFLSVAKPSPNSDPSGLRLEVTVRNPGSEPVEGVSLDAIYQAADGTTVATIRQDFPEVTVAPGEELALPSFVIENLLADNELVVTSPQSDIRPEPSKYFYFCKICPVGTLEAYLPAVANASDEGIYGVEGGAVARSLADNWFRLALAGGVLVMMWLASRFFCRVMCPLGACYGLTTRLALSRIELDTSQCTHCQACTKACPVELDVPSEVGSSECIACGDCIPACPQQGIRRRFGW
jgi:polyferredoxin